MSEHENVGGQDKIRDEIEERKRIKKEKKGKRRAIDHPDDHVESKKTQIESVDNEIEDEDVDSVKKDSKEPSKRQLKREKVEKQYADRREASKLEAAQKALTYISKWKHAKSDWKFEKLRQIWLMDHLLDDNLVPDSIFPIALEYFEGCKGMARQQLVKKMMEVIKKVEELKENEKEDESEPTDTSEYQRARQILQALPTEG